MRREAQPTYGLVAFLKATNLPWVRPAEDGQNLENALAVEPAESAPLVSGSVAVSGSVLHPASNSTRIGAYTGQMLEPFQVRPLRAGDTEPLSWPWDIEVNSRWFQSHMPWGSLIFSGANVTGLLVAVRTDAGVVESFDALITTGAPITESVRSRAKTQAKALNSMDFSLEYHFGADASGVYSGADGFRVPLATVLGPGLLKGIDFSRHDVAGVDVDMLGLSPFQHLALTFPLIHTWDGGSGLALRQAAFGELP
ncbi:DUF6177 family protein [Pseudarthrobacter sp. SSS035]|uniref:DUF6177 family protein n=1 Tax=Pseudarthrobacter sp. SSS035 TaxID=2931399 RepID=UPI0020107B49|nr:DUF6177 family protein [Pseudarthrobacter sp. SSS035]